MADEPKQSQSDKFRDLARDLECDESEERFEEAVKRIADKSQRPVPDKKALP